MPSKTDEEEGFPCQKGCGPKKTFQTEDALENHYIKDHSEPLDDPKRKFLQVLTRAGVKGPRDAITDVFFQQGPVDYEQDAGAPMRLVRLLEEQRIDTSTINLVCQSWFGGKTLKEIKAEAGEDTKTASKGRKKEDSTNGTDIMEDALDEEYAMMRKQFKFKQLKKMLRELDTEDGGGARKPPQPEELVEVELSGGTVVKVSPEKALEHERRMAAIQAKKDEADSKRREEEDRKAREAEERQRREEDKPKRSKRTLEDGSTVEMTDDEWVNYGLRLEAIRNKPKKDEVDVGKLKDEFDRRLEAERREWEKKFEESSKNREISELREDIRKVGQAAAGKSDLEYTLDQVARLEASGLKKGDTNIEAAKIDIEKLKADKTMTAFLMELQSLHRKTDRLSAVAETYFKTQIRKQAGETAPEMNEDYEEGDEGGKEGTPANGQ